MKSNSFQYKLQEGLYMGGGGGGGAYNCMYFLVYQEMGL